MRKYLFLLLFPLATTVYADKVGKAVVSRSWSLLSLDYFGVRYREVENLRDPYMPEYNTVASKCTGVREDGTPSGECWSYGANALFNLSVLKIPDMVNVFWRNDVKMDATTRQVRHVGWHWKAGFDFGRVEFGREHESNHCLECYRDIRYPLQDYYYFEYSFYGKKEGL